MKNLAINVLAVVLGLVVGSIVNMGMIMVGSLVIPPPEGVNTADLESIKASMHLYGPEQFIVPFVAHALGTLIGALVTCLVAVSNRVAMTFVTGGLFLLGGILAATMIPAPLWFIVIDLTLAYLPMAWLGTKWGKRIKKDYYTI